MVGWKQRSLFGVLATAMWLTACADETIAHEQNDLLNNATPFNEIVMRCTHNSYHLEPAKLAHASHAYSHLPLGEQLDAGVRAFELDIHGQPGFPVYHIKGVDQRSTCENITACLQEIAAWSAANPLHHMLVVWIEIKDEIDPPQFRVKNYSALDAAIRTALGKRRLYTPLDFARGYESPRAALAERGWPTVGETRGRVMVVLLDTDAPHYRAYRAYDSGKAGPAMFSRASVEDYGEPWAVVAKVDNPRDATAIRRALDADMLVASNTGGAGDSDEINRQRLDGGLANGSHMLCDDFPTPTTDGSYWMDIPEFFPSGCNAQTATDVCHAMNEPELH